MLFELEKIRIFLGDGSAQIFGTMEQRILVGIVFINLLYWTGLMDWYFNRFVSYYSIRWAQVSEQIDPSFAEEVANIGQMVTILLLIVAIYNVIEKINKYFYKLLCK